MIGSTVVVARAEAVAAPSGAVEQSDALASINEYRAMSGLAPVISNDTLTQGARDHACYMLANGMSHDESSSAPGYTVDGRYAGMHGNVAVTSDSTKSGDGFVKLWMAAPFHAVGLLRPNLTAVSYGSCTDPAAPLVWRKAATVDVLSGLSVRRRLAAPILWPGDGSTTSLDRFIVETPDPLPMCGWSSGGGLPVLALMPEATNNASATISGPAGPLQTCTLFDKNVTDPTAKAILAGDNVITVLPRNALVAGTYTVRITTDVRVVSWSFTVDPNAIRPLNVAPVVLGVVAPIVAAIITPALTPDVTPSRMALGVPTSTTTATTTGTTTATTAMTTGVPISTGTIGATTVIGPAGGYRPVAPFRLVDTRDGPLGSRPTRGRITRVQVAGQGSVPADARAVSANFTAVGSMQDGYLTAYPCTPMAPVASTVNFTAVSVTANAALVPLDVSGGVCVFSSATTDLVIDVSGYVSPSSPGRFTPTGPVRAFDTRLGYRSSGRLSAGETLEVQIAGTDTGVPLDAQAVEINVTAVDPDADSFVTVYGCSSDRPLASTLNPHVDGVRSNSIFVDLSPTGTVCFYSPVAVDLVADVSGFVSSSGGLRFTPLATMRVTDTRSPVSELDLGTSGAPLAAGSTHELSLAGLRGIPSDATGLSINLTATDASGAGFVTLWPCDPNRPAVSALNATSGITIASGAQVRLSGHGSVCVYTQTTTHLIIDVNGFWGT